MWCCMSPANMKDTRTQSGPTSTSPMEFVKRSQSLNSMATQSATQTQAPFYSRTAMGHDTSVLISTIRVKFGESSKFLPVVHRPLKHLHNSSGISFLTTTSCDEQGLCQKTPGA